MGRGWLARTDRSRKSRAVISTLPSSVNCLRRTFRSANSPSIVPPYARRSKSLEVLIPVLYLKGISSGDFEEALAALVGTDAPGLSASTIARLKSLPSRKRGRRGARSTRAGRNVICRQSVTFIAGPTASILRPGSRNRRSASWSSSARRRKAGRSLSASPMACARAHNRGVICCSI